MLFRHLRLLGLLTVLALQTNPPAGDPPAGDPPAGDPPQTDPPASDPPLGEAGENALKAERAARKAAEKDRADLQKRLDAIEAANRKKQDDEAAEQGKWQELAEKREADLTKATNDLTTTTATLETLEAYVKADIADVRKQIAEAAKGNGAAKVLLDFHPGDEADIPALLAWTTKAKAQLPELTEKPRTPGNGPNPPASDGKKPKPARLIDVRTAF